MMRAALTVGRLATSEASAAGHGGSRAAHARRIGDTLRRGRHGLVRVLGLPLLILWMPGILLVLPVIILALMTDVVMTLYRGE